MKKDEYLFINQCMELLNSIRRPRIVMPGYEDMPIPDNIQNRIFIERMILAKNGEMMATETETLWYLSTASLTRPFSHSWYKIFMYLSGDGVENCKKNCLILLKPKSFLSHMKNLILKN